MDKTQKLLNFSKDYRVFRAIENQKKIDTSFLNCSIFRRYSPREVREIYFNAMETGMYEGLKLSMENMKRIDLFNSCTEERQKEYVEKFLALSAEYSCSISYHPEKGMIINDCL